MKTKNQYINWTGVELFVDNNFINDAFELDVGEVLDEASLALDERVYAIIQTDEDLDLIDNFKSVDDNVELLKA